jgi:CTP synthase (UTP-ammonia lyase)
MNKPLRVGVIGDYDPGMRYHVATDQAMRHAAAALSVSVEPSWLPTDSLAQGDLAPTLREFDALWCAPGSPYRSTQGALRAIRFAREERRPFVGT